ncbi:MAG: TPM domain-containing protein [Flavobacteriales bacterium]
MSINSIELHRKVEAAIEEAERNTSAELRVHLEEKCNEDPLDRASFIFEKLEMHKTAARNGVLIYVAFTNRKLAILGDVGIHIHVAPETWETIKNAMTHAFAQGNYEAGLCSAVASVGEHLKHFFPYHRDDNNELPNSVSTHSFRS